MKPTPLQISKQVDAWMPEVIRIRRKLHRHPECSGKERHTAHFLAQQCRDIGLDVTTGIGGHGLLARLRIAPDAPWIALRADMDALPMNDAKDKPYASAEHGAAHACGHDAHSAMLLGTAMLLSEIQSQLKCNVALVFQPAEETCAGAAAMLADGLFSDFKPERMYALHVYPYLPSGCIGMRQGTMCAAADMFEVELRGRGGHAARPHECTDVILIASHIIQALHHIVSRRINPLHPAVLSIAQIKAGFAANVMPDQVSFSGTVRSLHPETHEEIRSRMDRIIRQTAESWGATAHFTLRQATPMLINDAEALTEARHAFASWMDDVPLVELEEPSMGGEDFAVFLREIPGCLFRLGTGAGPETRYPLHHPCFDIDESAMRSGILAFASLVLDFGR